MSISIVILTLNEEVNLPDALASAVHSDDIVVFDSFSADRTIEIAATAGVRVVQRRFDNYAAQRNAALTDVSYKHPWVLMLDADERITPALWQEMVARVAIATSDETMFRMRRMDYFMGRWLRRSSGYPTWFGRLLRIGGVRVEREINEEYVTEGQIGFLSEHLLHYPFNRGFEYWFERHNKYSTAEARRLIFEKRLKWRAADLISADPTVRRKCLKQLAYRLPFRPTLVFLYLYFIRLGCTDGLAGLYFCRMRSIYEYMIDIKVTEAESTTVS